MRTSADTVEDLVGEEKDTFTALTRQPVSDARPPASAPIGIVTARFHGSTLTIVLCWPDYQDRLTKSSWPGRRRFSAPRRSAPQSWSSARRTMCGGRSSSA